MAIDVVGRANFATGEVTEIKMEPRSEYMEIATEEDRNVYADAGSVWNSAVPWAQGPRRLGGDRTGDAVWVANWWGENLAKIDIHTSKVTYYPVPARHSGPYAAVVDKNHIVWVNMMNNDSGGEVRPGNGTMDRIHAADSRGRDAAHCRAGSILSSDGSGSLLAIEQGGPFAVPHPAGASAAEGAGQQRGTRTPGGCPVTAEETDEQGRRKLISGGSRHSC